MIKILIFSGECKKSSNEMKGDLAKIQNIRKNEKNEIVGDTLYMVGTLTDPQVHVVQLKYNSNKEC